MANPMPSAAQPLVDPRSGIIKTPWLMWLSQGGSGGASGVSSFNTRVGAVTLNGTDVSTALGYTPYNAANPAGYITAAGAPVQSVAGKTGAVTLVVGDVSGAAPSSAPTFTGASVTLSGSTNLIRGSAPQEGYSVPIAQTAPSVCLKDGSIASPLTTTVYNTPMLYLERHTSNPTTTQYADWSNNLLQPVALVECRAYGNEAGNPTGYAARVLSSATAPASSQPLMGIACQAESDAPAGTKNFDCWGANFIAKFGSGNQPANLIGMEADLIPASAAAAGKKPGTPGASNFLGVWSVVDGRAGGSGNTAFYSFGLSGNWEYGMVLDNVVNTFLTTSSTATLVNGIDFSTCSFSGYAFISPSVAISGAGGIYSASPSAGIGYTPGSGGTVNQLTSKATAVTLNKISGQVTMNNAALAAGAKVSFFVNNTACGATDIPAVAVVSGGTAGAYRATCNLVAGGTFLVTVENITAGPLSESPVIGFVIIKGSST